MSVQRSSRMTRDCGGVVTTPPISDGGTVSTVDQLSCRYAGQSVTYCLQFTADECNSATVMESTGQCT